MANVVISIGSNIEPFEHIPKAVRALVNEFGGVSFSPVYESNAVGFDGDNFLNLVAQFETQRSVSDLQGWCKYYEQQHGRDPKAAKFTPRTIDLDILLYDNYIQSVSTEHNLPQLPRAEITYNAFVLKPLADLLPHWQHPELAQDYQTLWRQFEQRPQAAEQSLRRIEFDWTAALGTTVAS